MKPTRTRSPNVRRAYDAWASSYDEDRNPTRDLDARVLRRTFSGHRLGSTLELGCGTGKNTALLAKASRRLLALDFSEEMLDRARAKIRSPRVRFAAADLTERWPCPSSRIDHAVCDLVLEHVEDLGFIFSEARRVLKPRGRFFLCELHPARQYEGKRARFNRGGRTRKVAAHTHHVSDFISAALANGFVLERLDEWWGPQDKGRPPRLLSLLLRKR